MKNKKINLLVFYYLSLVFLEIVFRWANFGISFDMGILYVILLSIPFAFLLKFVSILFNNKINKILTFCVFGFITIFYIAQLVYCKLYESIFSLYSLAATNQAVDSIGQVIQKLINNWYVVISLFVPFIILIVFNKKISFQKSNIKKILLDITCIIFFGFLCILSLNFDKKDMYSAKNLFYNIHLPSISITKLGLSTTFSIDIYRTIFGFEEIIPVTDNNPKVIIPEEEEVKYNVLDIDFDSLIASENNNSIKNMHEYFKNASVTKKNKYTGMYKGKNLIFITAEGFNTIAIDKDLTPTLYKLSTNSFTFDNFYTPLFLSTIDGEYQALMGLIPKSGAWSLSLARNIKTPYTYGNAFLKEGYNTRAYHDGTYTYYKRNLSYPTLGFESYIACRNGLEKLMNCQKWPQSDVEMMNATIGDYINDKPFMTYYLSISGHLNYTFMGNNMAAKNKSLVDHLPYSLEAKAYLASQIEFDRAIEILLTKLEEAGELNDTVIAIVGDHYPYGLTLEQVNELSTFERDKNFEVHHSTLMLYNPETELTNIEKPVGSIDILPTILNLFGIEYDSRLIIGKDMLSDEKGLVMFQNRSWITEKGRYSTITKTFTPNEGVNVEEDYVNIINNQVSLKFSMSRGVLDNNYYKLVLGE